jgi:hypothetical protein
MSTPRGEKPSRTTDFPDTFFLSLGDVQKYAENNNGLHRLTQNFSVWLADRTLEAERSAERAKMMAACALLLSLITALSSLLTWNTFAR